MKIILVLIAALYFYDGGAIGAMLMNFLLVALFIKALVNVPDIIGNAFARRKHM